MLSQSNQPHGTLTPYEALSHTHPPGGKMSRHPPPPRAPPSTHPIPIHDLHPLRNQQQPGHPNWETRADTYHTHPSPLIGPRTTIMQSSALPSPRHAYTPSRRWWRGGMVRMMPSYDWFDSGARQTTHLQVACCVGAACSPHLLDGRHDALPGHRAKLSIMRARLS